jgi:hypothetical protein
MDLKNNGHANIKKRRREEKGKEERESVEGEIEQRIHEASEGEGAEDSYFTGGC